MSASDTEDGPRTRKSESAFRTISEVAEELDVAQHVLRFWEGRFPQVRPIKRGGGRRYYRPEDVGLLKEIRSLLYVEGYTIKGAQKLLRERRARRKTPDAWREPPAGVLEPQRGASEAQAWPPRDPDEAVAATPAPVEPARMSPAAEPQPAAPAGLAEGQSEAWRGEERADPAQGDEALRARLSNLRDELASLLEAVAAARREAEEGTRAFEVAGEDDELSFL